MYGIVELWKALSVCGSWPLVPLLPDVGLRLMFALVVCLFAWAWLPTAFMLPTGSIIASTTLLVSRCFPATVLMAGFVMHNRGIAALVSCAGLTTKAVVYVNCMAGWLRPINNATDRLLALSRPQAGSIQNVSGERPRNTLKRARCRVQILECHVGSRISRSP